MTASSTFAASSTGRRYGEPKTPARAQARRRPHAVTRHAPARAQARLRVLSPADPVFATRTGRPLYYRNVIRGLRLALGKAGLDGDGRPRLRFHDLRHTYASLLIAQGLNIVFVGHQLGHASPSFTLPRLRRPVRSGRARQPRPRPARGGLRRDAYGDLARGFPLRFPSPREPLVQAVCGGYAPAATGAVVPRGMRRVGLSPTDGGAK